MRTALITGIGGQDGGYLAAHLLAEGYRVVGTSRDADAIHACTGILFNHESPLRPERFVTQKIAAAACRIAAGEQRTVQLGDLSVRRDWGWAAEYVVAMHAMLRRERPEDLVIATGFTCALEDFVHEAFATVGLDWRRHVRHDPALARPTELACSRADASRARAVLGWQARVRMPEVARMMVEAGLAAAGAAAHRRAA